MRKDKLKVSFKKELKKIVKKIVTEYKPEKIIVFGGLATGKLHPDSDIDLLIIKKTKERYWDRVKKVIYSFDSNIPTDIFVLTPKELAKAISENRFFIVDEILPKGKVLYEKKH
jgi:predicted nucleotidyltransferase